MLMTTRISDTGESGDSPVASPAQFMHWRAQSNVIHEVSAFGIDTVNYSGGDVIEQWRAMQVSADMFRCWGMPILLGRGFHGAWILS
jgi:hypothetical protein